MNGALHTVDNVKHGGGLANSTAKPLFIDTVATFTQSFSMKEAELRGLVRESHLKPFRVCMDDGRVYTISHPDFAMVANGALVIGSGPGHSLGGPGFVICYLEHVSRVELMKDRRKAA
jgi:hypothetical protein